MSLDDERRQSIARSHRAGLDEGVILQAAAVLADANGIEQLNVAQLAERLGVRAPSLYKHVASLDEIRRGLAVLGARELAQHLGRAAIGKSGREGVYAVADAYRRFARERPGLYAALQRASDPADANGQALRAASEEILAVLRAVLAPYGLDGEGEIHAIRTLRSLAHGFVALEAVGGFGIPIALDASYHYAIELFTRGLLHSNDGA
ncbi:MAG TPA: WHG domain-containing protein [Ktedonobacterales bacterium]|nr:WHG domain-containing protein [Ktedonobacterales bacterium]